MGTTTEELVSLWIQIWNMQEELTCAKENAANTATAGQQSHVVTEPVGTTNRKTTPELTEGEALQTGPESAKIIKTLRQELAVVGRLWRPTRVKDQAEQGERTSGKERSNTRDLERNARKEAGA